MESSGQSYIIWLLAYMVVVIVLVAFAKIFIARELIRGYAVIQARTLSGEGED